MLVVRDFKHLGGAVGADEGWRGEDRRRVACGGEATVDNVRCLCRAHNQLEAERRFGAGFMEGKRRQAVESRQASRIVMRMGTRAGAGVTMTGTGDGTCAGAGPRALPGTSGTRAGACSPASYPERERCAASSGA